MKKNNFQTWLNTFSNSRKSADEIRKTLLDIARYSEPAIYEAIISTLREKDIKNLKKIKNDNEAQETAKKLFKLQTGMTINEFVGQIQIYLIEE